MGKIGNIVSATKMFLNFLGNILLPVEQILFPRNNVSQGGQTGKVNRKHSVSTTMFPEVGKQGNIYRKHNVSATMFPSLPRTLVFFAIHLSELCKITSRTSLPS